MPGNLLPESACGEMEPVSVPSFFEGQRSDAELIANPSKSLLQTPTRFVRAELVRDFDDDRLWH